MRLAPKLTLAFAGLAILPLLVMVGIRLGTERSRLMRQARGDVHRLARQTAGEADLILSRTLEQVRQLAASSLLGAELAAANRDYGDAKAESVTELLQARDRAWRDAPAEDPLVRVTLGGAAAEELMRFQNTAPRRYAEILVTDRFGGLHAATSRTSDYYQADEKWWQQVAGGQRPRAFVTRPAVDESAGVLSLDVAAPVHDSNGRLVGVLKVVHNAPALLSAVAELKPGETGAGHLVDAQGQTVFSTPGRPSWREFPVEAMRRLKAEASGVSTVRLQSHGACVLGYAFLPSTGDAEGTKISGSPWYVAVTQRASEVYAPTGWALWSSTPALLLPLIFLVPLAFYLRRHLIEPIRQLYAASERIGAGELDARVQVEYEDEIGAVARQFNRMAGALQRHEESQREEIERRTEELRQINVQTHLVRSAISATIESIADRMRSTVEKLKGGEPAAEPEPWGELTGLIEDLEDLSRIEIGGMDRQLQEVEAVAVLQSARRVLSPLASRHGVTLDFRPPPEEIPPLQADRAKIKQVLYALLSNAIKYGGEESTVTVSVQRREAATRFSVRDEGPGVGAGEQQAIFLPTPRRGTRPSAGGGGIGLNLCIARRLVELHGGEIGVENQPNEGSEFYFTVPDSPPS
ncbi:MAG: ATP-binding protein [Planctomycetota bacterium]